MPTSRKRVEDIRVSNSVLSDMITLVQLIKRFKHFVGLYLKEKKSWLYEQGLERKMWIVAITRVVTGSWRQNNLLESSLGLKPCSYNHDFLLCTHRHTSTKNI
jgi:hypothetical protein